jgi:hypothetical protein
MTQIRHPMRLCIHGHFYQPPRENPWIGEIEAQESAAPHHDWNERISRECYAPNGASRLLDHWGRIRGLVNNYRYLSFNFGPTLLDWIEKHDRDTLERILEADRLSRADQAGHGNAIAQVYNHTIQPLGTKRDRQTQIRWGLRDFKARFGRDSEGLWLAETAINMDTVVDLIECGVKYTILAPTQAERVRRLDGDTWIDVSDQSIDPGRPYRIFPLDAHGEPICGGHLDVFFYDGPISSAVGFEHLLRDATGYFEKLKSAWRPDSETPRLVNIATDGESYGHHEPFGDMALAYLFETLCPREGVVPTNYGHFLSLCPPVEEVRLKNAHGEGTAWSCAHGTGRWQRDCGCKTGGPAEWNQAWRTPLRKAMETTRDAAEAAWDLLAPDLLADPWDARMEWVATRTGATTREAWLARHLRPELDATGRTRALALMELVRMGQFCLTSCGWFFDDLGGLEPVQNLRYARRVCELLELLGRPSPERRILSTLESATSNVEARTGRWIWENWVRPRWGASHLVAAHALFERLVETSDDELPAKLFPHQVAVDLAHPAPDLWVGRATVSDPELATSTALRVLAWHPAGEGPEVRILEDAPELPVVDWSLSGNALRAAVELAWACRPFHLPDLLLDKRRDLADRRTRHALDDLLDLHEQLERASVDARTDLHSLGVQAPRFLLASRQILLEHRLADAVRKTLAGPDSTAVKAAQQALAEGKALGLDLDSRLPGRLLDRALQTQMRRIAEQADGEAAGSFKILLDIAEAARIPVSKAPLENMGERLRTERLDPVLRTPAPDATDRQKASIWIGILERLNFNMDIEREALAWGKAAE